MKNFTVLVTLLFALPVGVFAQSTHKSPAYKAESTEGKLHLYPVNAKTYTNIYVDWNELQPFTIYVCKEDNEVVAQWKGSTVKNYQKALDVSKMGPGSYYIKVKSPRAEITQGFTVAH